MTQVAGTVGGSAPRAAGFRTFVATPAGKIFLIVLATLTLAFSFYYLGPYLAIPTFILFGLGVPIYLGWKLPRQLAVLGIVALLLAAPIVNYELTAQAMVPSPSAGSDTDTTNSSTGAAVLTNATASPYNGPSGSQFTFTVDLYPNRLPAHYDPDVLWLYVSTCPGATGNSSPFCSSGYPFIQDNQTVVGDNASPTPLTFHVKLGGPNIWWWQMGLLARNLTYDAATNKTNATYRWIFLDAGNSYGAIQGPITGTWATTYELLLGNTILDVLFYPGIVFYLALLGYLWWKSRESKRKAQQSAAAGGSIPPTTGAPPSSDPPPIGTTASGGAARREELSCPKCGAVVYPGETSCWKCGASLAPGPAPLKSGGT